MIPLIMPTKRRRLNSTAKTWSGEQGISLQLWDSGGQERLRPTILQAFIRNCTCAIIVCDITNVTSLQQASKWIEDVRNLRGNDIIILVLGNKTDLTEERQVSTEEGETTAKEHKVMFLETSAKTECNVKQVFDGISVHCAAQIVPEPAFRGPTCPGFALKDEGSWCCCTKLFRKMFSFNDKC